MSLAPRSPHPARPDWIAAKPRELLEQALKKLVRDNEILRERNARLSHRVGVLSRAMEQAIELLRGRL